LSIADHIFQTCVFASVKMRLGSEGDSGGAQIPCYGFGCGHGLYTKDATFRKSTTPLQGNYGDEIWQKYASKRGVCKFANPPLEVAAIEKDLA